MRIRHETKPLRRDFTNLPARGLLLEADLQMHRSRLWAKLLVFDTPLSLRLFWKKCLGKGDLGKGCLGAVNALGYEVIEFRKDKTEKSILVVDPRYYCVIGLTKGRLNMEVVTHEAVHAGFCYAKRRKGDLWHGAKDLDEENVCYPAGIIASQINKVLHDAGLYPK